MYSLHYRSLTIVGCALALLTGTSLAQTALVLEGDAIPGVGNVTSIAYLDMNSQGTWIVEADTDNTDTTMDYVVLVDGIVAFQEGTTTGITAPAGATLNLADVMDVNSNGDLMFLHRINLAGGAGTTEALYFNGMLMVEGDVTPINAAGVPMGTVWDSLSEAWQNSSNQILLGGRTDSAEDILILLDHDGMGNITGETLLAMDGITLPGHISPVTGFSLSKPRQAMNDVGQILWYVDDDNTTPGGTPNDNICCDAWLYMNNSVLHQESDMVSAIPGRTYGHFSTLECDINNSGDYVLNVVLDSSVTTDNTAIIKNDVEIIAREGSPAPGVPGGFLLTSFGITPVQISEAGNVIWYGDWDDPDTDVDTGLFMDDTLLLQEGVSTIAGVVIDSFNSGSDSFAMTDDGQFLIFEAVLDNGIEGAFMMNLLQDIGTNYCVATGNSSGGSASIHALGDTSLATNSLTLQAQPVPDQPGIFYFGPDQVLIPFGDGFRCIGGVVTRINPPAAASGNVASRSVDVTAYAVPLGATNFQYWFRDPAAMGTGFNLSDAIEITFVP